MRRLAWVLALLLAACAAPITKAPAVTLAGVDIESLGLFEQRFILTLRVRNPNEVDIPVEGLVFDVELNGRHFADGVSGLAVTIPRLGEAMLEVRATSNLAAFLRQWRDMEKAGRPGLDYRVRGNLRVAGYGELPFDHRGEAAFPKLLPGGEGRPKPQPGAV
ncbi:MAG: Water Stress and Hypersensitive response domain protein [Rhodocyclaceae bacterium]|nr:Water Stress and Hypersensitive response domain protein [Rhodocyclaceae bacterium]